MSRRILESGRMLDSLLLELASQGGVQAITHPVRHRKSLAVTVKLNGFARSVEHHFTVGALANVFTEHALQILGELPIQVF